MTSRISAQTRLLVLATACLFSGWLAAPAAERAVSLGGLQLWNVDYWGTTSIGDFMGPNYEIKKLKPISIVGVRNGFHSGYVVLTSATGPINGLKATITDLVEKGGKNIPASQVRIRYPELARPETSWAPPYRFDRMLDEAPEEVKQTDLRSYRDWKPKNEGPIAMQPVWVTVGVPSNAAPGSYTATLTIEAENEKPYIVPVELTVCDWLLPAPHNYTMKNMVWFCPERTAIYYELPMWGDKHLEYCGKSLELALPLASQNVEANLVLRYLSRDNTEVMVKWIKQADGKFKYDFTVFDKYVETVAKSIGKPFVFRLNMWSSQVKPFHSVVVVDEASGKTEELEQPPQGTPESLAFWKPVLDEIHAHMDKRGWSDIMAANWHQYCGGPDSNTVSMLQKIWPGMKWADNDHGRRQGFPGNEEKDYTPVRVQSTVWQEGAMKARGYKGALLPGPAYCGHARGRTREWSSLWDLRAFLEETIMKGEHGVDPMGGDLWMTKDARGRWAGGNWAACALGPGNCTQAILAPGPNGPVVTERYEAMRESVQICEAILFIQHGLDAGKLDAALTARANKVLDERSAHLLAAQVLADKSGAMKFDRVKMAEGALEAENELFTVAAEVAKATKK